MSAGTDTQAKFSVPELGVHLSYRPGDVVAVCGKGFLHEVGDWSGGERVCMSHYMKDMCMNIWRSNVPIGPGKRTIVSCWKIDLEIQPENVF